MNESGDVEPDIIDEVWGIVQEIDNRLNEQHRLTYEIFYIFKLMGLPDLRVNFRNSLIELNESVKEDLDNNIRELEKQKKKLEESELNESEKEVLRNENRELEEKKKKLEEEVREAKESLRKRRIELNELNESEKENLRVNLRDSLNESELNESEKEDLRNILRELEESEKADLQELEQQIRELEEKIREEKEDLS